MDWRFYFKRLLRQMHWLILIATLGGAAGYGLMRIMPQDYVGQARLLVEAQEIPGDLAVSTVRSQGAEQVELVRQRILRRQTVLDLAERLGLFPHEATGSRAERTVQEMRERISLTTVGGREAPTLVTVAFRWPDARTAATVSNEILDIILREDVALRTRSATKTLEFFKQEVARLDAELAFHDKQILAFTQKQSDALPDSLDFRRKHQNAAEEHLMKIEEDRAAVMEKRMLLSEKQRLFAQGEGATQNVTIPIDQEKMQQLQAELSAQQTLLSARNPKVQILKSRLAALQSSGALQQAGGAGLRRSAEDDLSLAALDRQIAVLDKRKGHIVVKLDDLARSIDATTENAILLGNLERAKANTRIQYDQAIANKARAETGEMIETLQKGQRLTVFERAVVPSKPEGFSLRTAIISGALAGLALGLAVLLITLRLTKTVRRPQDLIDGLGITPFATLPFEKTLASYTDGRSVAALAGQSAAVTAAFLSASFAHPIFKIFGA